MATRRRRGGYDRTKAANAHWIVTEAYQVSPQVTLEKNDMCRVKGQKGEFRFLRHVVNPEVMDKYPDAYEWIDVVRLGTKAKPVRQVESYRVDMIQSAGKKAKTDRKRRAHTKAKKDDASARRVATRKANQG